MLKQKKKVGSYPLAAVLLSLTLALLIVGLLVVAGLQSGRLIDAVRSRFEVQVFLQHDLTVGQRDSLQQSIITQPWLATNDAGQRLLTYVSKEEAAKTFAKESGEDFSALLGDNPLRDAYRLRIAPAYTDSAKLAAVVSQLQGMPAVYEAVYEPDLLAALNANLSKLFFVLGGLAALLLTGVILLIHNTIRLAIYSQRLLIRSMQLVGASAWFIQKPFLWRAAMHSVYATGIALVLVALVVETAQQQLPELAAVTSTQDLVVAGSIQLLVGVLIGVGSAWRAVQKYLGMKLDQLY